MSAKVKKSNKGGSFAPALLNILGILILLVVFLSYLPLSVPKMMGYEVYNIVSESMTPTIPVGSVIYVQQTEAENLAEGDVIAFTRDGDVIAHRVVSNEVVMGRLITKGDANEEADLFPVEYTQVIGIVTYHVPYLGYLMAIYAGTAGKIYALLFAACGAMMNILAGRMRSSKRSKDVDKFIRNLEQKEEDQ